MINILVYDRGALLGIFEVPKPPENELITIYKDIPFKNCSPILIGVKINIMYFHDLDYGICITDEMAN